MSMNTTNGAAIVAPEQVGDLIIRPVLTASVAAQTFQVVQTASHDYRVPVVAADASAAWVAEGAEIVPSDVTLDEITVSPPKVAGLTIISNELANDSDPSAQQTVGDSLARDIARKVDAATFGSLASPAPAGLGSLAGVSTVAAGTGYTSLDPFVEAIAKAEEVGAVITSFVTTPAVALALAKIKQQTGSVVPLLGADPTSPSRRTIAGVPLYVSPAVATGVVWAIPSDRVLLVVRTDATVVADSSAYFSSDRVGVRATMRVAPAFPHAQAVVKISTTA